MDMARTWHRQGQHHRRLHEVAVPPPTLKLQVTKKGPEGFNVVLTTLKSFGGQDFRKTDYRFEAPGIIGVRTMDSKEGAPQFGAFLHTVPLGKGRSRLLFTVSQCLVECVCVSYLF